MKLWKRTVLLKLVTLICALIPVGTLSLYITGKRSLNNAAETYGRQLENGKQLRFFRFPFVEPCAIINTEHMFCTN